MNDIAQPMGRTFQALGIVALLLAGCAGTRPPPAAAPAPPAPVAAPAGDPAVEQFEQRQRERAEQAARQGRLAEALQAWDVLLTLRPAQAEYRAARAELQRQVQAQVAERLPKAAAAHKRGDLDTAAQLYLGVLALNPEHEAAAEGLRAVERERNKRQYVGKLARNTLVRRPAVEPPKTNGTAQRPAAKAAPKATGDRNELEHAAMLASQGELDDAIALLQAHLVAQRNDADAKRMLADLLALKEGQGRAKAP